METFYVDASSTAANSPPLPRTTICPLPINMNLGFNGPQEEEDWDSLNSIQKIIEEEENTIFNSCKDDFVAQHNDDFPVITSVFSLAPTCNQVKRESDNLKIGLIDSQFTFTPLINQTEIPNTFNHTKTGTCNKSPFVSSFVINCNRHSMSSQIRTTEEYIKDINPDFYDFSAGCHITPDSDTKALGLLPGDSIDGKYDCHAEEQPQLVAKRITSDAAKEDVMGEREKRINQLKNLLLQKKAEVEKVRFLSKKNSLSFTIDKLKDRLFTRKDGAEDQTYMAHPYAVSEKSPPKVPNLDLKYMYSCGGLPNLVLDENVRKKGKTKFVEKKWKNNQQKSSDHSEIIGESASNQKKRRGRPKKMLPKSNMITNKTKRLAGRYENHCCDKISVESCSRSNIPPLASMSACLSYQDHYGFNSAYNDREKSGFSNYPVHFHTSIASAESSTAVGSRSNVPDPFRC